ncbi:hypothetical protein MKX03_008174 [Papaver bracteatum]|nr:hypothetical protein MKX03_008174 [Papaver bracteatum]
MLVITQAFAGHLGNLELAAMAVSTVVIVGFSFGLLLGMASALETLCGQGYGAKRYHMLGIYLQRSWVVLTITAILLLPVYIFTTPILKFLGQPDEIAKLSGLVTIWLIPLNFALALQFPMQIFLQCQLQTPIVAWVCSGDLLFHILFNWLLRLRQVSRGGLQVLDCSLILLVVVALKLGLVFLFKLFLASGNFLNSPWLLALENWYYRILVLMTGNLKNATVAVSALTVCMSINGWELMIPLAFCTATG